MRGFIANTDPEWHRYLARGNNGQPWREVNFWRPSDKPFKALRPGEPLLFRLKSPANAIGGFGFVQTDSLLPVWLAWETFREGNGVASLEAFNERLQAIRQRNGIRPRGDIIIGCTVLLAPVFFSEHEWVRLPSDWSKHAVKGKGYDLSVGEGARVWRECLERVRGRALPTAADAAMLPERYGAPQLVPPRLGQAGFRISVMDAYGRACAVTTEHSLPVLEAAHIHPYSEEGGHDVRNGLLLRSDIHRLFDRGYVTVTPDLRFKVSPRLRDDYDNGKTYYALDDRPIVIPREPDLAPSREALAWHAEHRFLAG